MLPTPCTSHVDFDTIYEPSEDSYLFLDTLSSPSESAWLTRRFEKSSSPDQSTASPLVIEIGTGSGVVLGFVAANSQIIFGRRDILPLGIDVNRNACVATRETANKAIKERQSNNEGSTGQKTAYLSSVMADLGSSIRPGSVDVLLFNPPYVPSEELPRLPSVTEQDVDETGMSKLAKFERDSYFLSLTYAGGRDGMETTDRLLEEIPGLLDPRRGVAYVLFCAQNRPQEVKERIRAWGDGWQAETVGNSGVQAGWEKLVIVRIWREAA
ncbi:S-adenosylmethionine-dependent methyltransferase [Aspergillus alliaceus]|uniref:S-adenosylmethionine-dependent methyltransferase n=1 Tax=Petromyces alliaceus TaxID=209559 RepID=A0A5N6G142_PETAA|nr:methyltransferase domain-containing protein [Aspergillus alliaceus]KAB8235249.1 methyltransferase domain-containing protein [Aspergillus alliaceus]KAF5863705.1 S-adenosylmethionine-dependent methyltransferase [Aspergillus burnettii]